jgi:formate/nitrite transporter FocA (FNT family)
MDYLKPTEVVALMIETGTRKSTLSVNDLLVRGALSGGILGIATTLAITAAVQTNVPLAGALIFPVGFVMIVLLGLELVTGSFAVLPMAQMDGNLWCHAAQLGLGVRGQPHRQRAVRGAGLGCADYVRRDARRYGR